MRPLSRIRVGHGLGPSMGWVGSLGWIGSEFFKFLVGWVGLGGLGGDLTVLYF